MICPSDFRDVNGPFKNVDLPWRDDNTCHYCGSMHPDGFMNEVRKGVRLGATDKPYKAYCNDGSQMRKFYFVHLSEDQKKEFVRLYNDKIVNVSFYVFPNFMRSANL